MNPTVAVAAIGFVATLVGSWLAASWQHRNARDLQLLDARVRVSGECAASLYEYERTTYNRVKARLDHRPDESRDVLRQDAYRSNSSSRAAIGQLRVLTSSKTVPDDFEALRLAIGNLNAASGPADLKTRHDQIYAELDRVLDRARTDLTR